MLVLMVLIDLYPYSGIWQSSVIPVQDYVLTHFKPCTHTCTPIEDNSSGTHIGAVVPLTTSLIT